MSALKVWVVGNKRIALMSNGVVRIEEPGLPFVDKGTPGRDGQPAFTVATGLAGLMGVIETLQEVANEIVERRRQDSGARKE